MPQIVSGHEWKHSHLLGVYLLGRSTFSEKETIRGDSTLGGHGVRAQLSLGRQDIELQVEATPTTTHVILEGDTYKE